MVNQPVLACLILVVAGLAGCVGGDASSTDADQGPSSAVPVPDDDTGVVSVLVTDDAFGPLEGATVGILEPSFDGLTDAGGRAQLGSVPPGPRTVVVQKLGYDSVARKVDVVAGETVEVSIQLAAVEILEARYFTYVFHGHISCGAGLIQIRLITVCGTTGTGTAAGNVTVDPNHKDEFRQTGTPDLKTVVGELVWTSSAALTAKEFTLALYQGWICTPFCSSDNDYGDTNGPSPVVHRANAPFAGLKKGPATISHVVGLPGQSAEPPFLIFVVQQDYDIYSTHFWGQEAPEGFAARPDS